MKSKNTQRICNTCELRPTTMCANLTESELALIQETKSCLSYQKDDTIFKEWSPGYGIYFLTSGKVKLSKLAQNGKETIIRLVKKGDLLGFLILHGNEKFTNTAKALEDSTVCYIPKDTFLTLLNTNSQLSTALLTLFSQELNRTEQSITNVQKTVKERIAETILFMYQIYGFESDNKTIDVSLKREEIGNIALTTLETTVRIIKDFERDGLIELKGKRIVILNMPKLIREANLDN